MINPEIVNGVLRRETPLYQTPAEMATRNASRAVEDMLSNIEGDPPELTRAQDLINQAFALLADYVDAIRATHPAEAEKDETEIGQIKIG